MADTFGLRGLASDADDSYSAGLDRLVSALDAREQRSFNPTLLAMAQGFLAPTKTGSFGESLGQAAGNVGEVQRQQEKEAIDNARMRLEVAQLKKKAEDEQRMRAVGQTIFTPIRSVDEKGQPKLSYQLNKNAVFSALSQAPDPLEAASKYAQMIPNMRKAGLLADSGAEGTPFDALALMAPTPAIAQQAQHLAKQYRSGMLDEDKANTLANQMLTMSTAHMDRQQAMQFNQAMQGLMMGLRQETQSLAREKFTDKKQAEVDAKTKAAADVGDLLTEMQNSYDELKKFGSITSTGESALSNIGAAAKTSGVGQALGRVMGTETQAKIGEIETMKPLLLQAIKNATGMSATQMNSNAELKFYLNAATDPKLGYETNINAIKRLQKMYGPESLPARITAKEPPKEPTLRWNPATNKWE